MCFMLSCILACVPGTLNSEMRESFPILVRNGKHCGMTGPGEKPHGESGDQTQVSRSPGGRFTARPTKQCRGEGGRDGGGGG